MDRADVTAQVLDAKRRMALSFTAIAEQLGADRVWLTAALLGQHPMPPELAAKAVDLLGLPAEAAASRRSRGSGSPRARPPPRPAARAGRRPSPPARGASDAGRGALR